MVNGVIRIDIMEIISCRLGVENCILEDFTLPFKIPVHLREISKIK